MEQFAWVEKYRPQSVDECILPDRLKTHLNAIITSDKNSNLLFTGTSGIGKTTAAKAIARQLNAEIMHINGSDENGIDVLRTKVRNFASSLSLDGNRKIVLFDEADFLNPQSTQPALRGFMEEFAGTCSFFLTCNFVNRILDAIQSRCAVVDFQLVGKEKPQMAATFFRRSAEILTKEGITFDKKVLQEVILRFLEPQLDYRRILNALQFHSGAGVLSEGILRAISDKDTEELLGYLKKKDFSAMHKWVVTHDDADASGFFRMLTNILIKYVDDAALPELIVSLGLYNQQHGIAVDSQLNYIACLTEIMFTAKWK